MTQNLTATTKIQVRTTLNVLQNTPQHFGTFSDANIAKEVKIECEEEHSSDESEEDEETAGKVVTRAGVEVNK